MRESRASDDLFTYAVNVVHATCQLSATCTFIINHLQITQLFSITLALSVSASLDVTFTFKITAGSLLKLFYHLHSTMKKLTTPLSFTFEMMVLAAVENPMKYRLNRLYLTRLHSKTGPKFQITVRCISNNINLCFSLFSYGSC